jgi:hypothetical protein
MDKKETKWNFASGASITFDKPHPDDQEFKSAGFSMKAWCDNDGLFHCEIARNKDGQVIGSITDDPKDDVLLTPVTVDLDPSFKDDALIAAICSPASISDPRTHICFSCNKPVTPNTYNFGDRMRDFCPTCGEEVTE